MSYVYIKDFIKNTVLSNKDVKFGVEEILNLRKEFSNDIFDEKKLRNAIRNAFDDLSHDPRFNVIKEGRKSISFNHNCNHEKQKEGSINDKKDKQYFWFVFTPLLLFFGLIQVVSDIYFNKIFFTFTLLSFLSFSFILFHNEYMSDGNTLSNQISLTVPVFGFIYYVLNDPVFSKYSYLSLDSHILSSNNLYSISISLFLALFILMTTKNKLVFLLVIIFIVLFPFTQFILFVFIGLIILLYYILKKYNRQKEFEDATRLLDDIKRIYESKNYFYVLIYSIIATLFITIINRSDEIKNSYYHHLSEYNYGFCKNLNYDLLVIKNSAKNDSVVIFSENLYNSIIFYLFTQSVDIKELGLLDNDAIITSEGFLSSAVTYNTILSTYKNNPDLLDKDRYKINQIKKKINNLDDYIKNNNTVINYYLKYSNIEGSLFFYKCN